MVRARAAIAAVLLFLPWSMLNADVLVMKDGTRVEGKIIHENKQSVTVLFVRDGNEATVVYPRNRIDNIIREERTSRERLRDEYQERVRAVPAGDAEAWWKLAAWAAENGLSPERLEALERVIEIDPDHAQAREALGHRRVDGHWLPADEAQRLVEEQRRRREQAARDAKRASGLVEWAGEWYKPEELQALAAMKQAESLGGIAERMKVMETSFGALAERMDAIDARLDKLQNAMDPEAVNGRFDRLERGLQSMSDSLHARVEDIRARAAEDHAEFRTRVSDLTIAIEGVRDELQNLRRDLAASGHR